MTLPPFLIVILLSCTAVWLAMAGIVLMWLPKEVEEARLDREWDLSERMRLALWIQQLEPVNRFIDSINTAFGVLADQANDWLEAYDKAAADYVAYVEQT